MTANQAKKLLKGYLDSEGMSYSKLTAQTVSFSDLARASSVFVTVHNVGSAAAAKSIKAFAYASGFCVDFA